MHRHGDGAAAAQNPGDPGLPCVYTRADLGIGSDPDSWSAPDLEGLTVESGLGRIRPLKLKLVT